ncbi:MAG: methyltransferase domain-containing protein [Actinomycetota bacterium]|nr:methyltransferase domain-containing protein [Actinomycetota bacterium]
MRESARLFGSFLAHPLRVGAVVPTSQRTVRLMLDMANLPGAVRVAELGSGTGPYTTEILNRVGPDARVVAFEIDPTLAADLSARLADSRLEVVTDSAERADEYLDGEKMDVVVSSLPFTSMPKQVRRSILDQASRILGDDGVLLVIQYSTVLQRDLRRRFASIRRRVSLFNVPPAFLYACRRPLKGTSTP